MSRHGRGLEPFINYSCALSLVFSYTFHLLPLSNLFLTIRHPPLSSCLCDVLSHFFATVSLKAPRDLQDTYVNHDQCPARGQIALVWLWAHDLPQLPAGGFFTFPAGPWTSARLKPFGLPCSGLPKQVRLLIVGLPVPTDHLQGPIQRMESRGSSRTAAPAVRYSYGHLDSFRTHGPAHVSNLVGCYLWCPIG